MHTPLRVVMLSIVFQQVVGPGSWALTRTAATHKSWVGGWWLVSLSRRLVQLTAEASPHPTSIKIRLQIYGVCGHIASHHLNHSITSSRTFSHHPHLLISLSMLNSAVQQRQKFATLLDKHSLILENLQQPLTFNRLSRIPG
jgi:hypothetical protein